MIHRQVYIQIKDVDDQTNFYKDAFAKYIQ